MPRAVPHPIIVGDYYTNGRAMVEVEAFLSNGDVIVRNIVTEALLPPMRSVRFRTAWRRVERDTVQPEREAA
jgi:hypothetical protein